jgi:hypothetical protein
VRERRAIERLRPGEVGETVVECLFDGVLRRLNRIGVDDPDPQPGREPAPLAVSVLEGRGDALVAGPFVGLVSPRFARSIVPSVSLFQKTSHRGASASRMIRFTSPSDFVASVSKRGVTGIPVSFVKSSRICCEKTAS